MQNKRLDEAGLTMIELLVSLVILSIVILGLMSFFSQHISYSVKVEDKLTAINLAEKVLSDYKITPEEYSSHELNGKYYYSKVTILHDQKYLDLVPIRVEIFTDSNYRETSLSTKIYGYMEAE